MGDHEIPEDVTPPPRYRRRAADRVPWPVRFAAQVVAATASGGLVGYTFLSQHYVSTETFQGHIRIQEKEQAADAKALVELERRMALAETELRDKTDANQFADIKAQLSEIRTDIAWMKHRWR